MILKTIEKTQHYLTNDQFTQVNKALMGGAQWVTIPDGTILRASSITGIFPGGNPVSQKKVKVIAEARRTASDAAIKAARQKLQDRLDKVKERKSRND